MYFFWRYQIKKAIWPDFSDPKNWYNLYVLRSSTGVRAKMSSCEFTNESVSAHRKGTPRSLRNAGERTCRQIAGDSFLKLMEYLRIVVLQDAVLLVNKDELKDHQVFQH